MAATNCPLPSIADISCYDKLSALGADVCNSNYPTQCAAGASSSGQDSTARRRFGSTGIEGAQAAIKIKQASAVARPVDHDLSHFHSHLALAPSRLR